jgi:hypothetical protein
MGGHPLLSKFMKGVRRLCPGKASSVPNWDLDVVLSALARPLFELLGLVFEAPIHAGGIPTSTKRISELHTIHMKSFDIYN